MDVVLILLFLFGVCPLIIGAVLSSCDDEVPRPLSRRSNIRVLSMREPRDKGAA